MADFIVVCGALVTLFGFILLFWFIRRLGFLELEAAFMNDDYQRPKMHPQPMVEVKNPFKMVVSSSNIFGCIELTVSCTQSCYIRCYCNVKKETLEQKVMESQSERNGDSYEDLDTSNFCSLQTLLQHSYKTMIKSEFSEACTEKRLVYNIHDINKKSPGHPDFTSDQTQYNLVVAMELTQENRNQMDSPCNIGTMLVGIDLRKQEQTTKPVVVQQYIQSLNGQLFKLKKLFLEEASNPPSEQSSYQESGQNLCIICQLLPISRAIIPCGHACLCVLCFEKMNACPMCRNAITSSFILREEPNVNHDDQQFSDVLKRMNPVEIIRGIYNAS